MIEPYNLETNSSMNLMLENMMENTFFYNYIFNNFDFYKFNYLANSGAVLNPKKQLNLV